VNLIKNPFSYCFGRSQQTNCKTNNIDSTTQRYSQTYNNLDWTWELPVEQDYASSITYKPTTKGLNAMAQPGTSKGDSIVEATYYAYKLSGGAATRMPKADDWVKIRPSSSGAIFVDAEGNLANPRERGVIITGTNPSKKRPIRIAVIKGADSPVLGGIFTPGDPGYFPPPWYNQEAIDKAADLFKPGSVAEFLPVPKDRSHPDTVKAYYPGSVGTLFDIADRFHNDVNTFLDDCETKAVCTAADGTKLNKDNIANYITVHASAYYHTNLGDYTAHRDPISVSCTDPIFKGVNGGNCYTNEYNYYLAWDLKANSGRFVGAGAYVGVSKFYMQIKYLENNKPKSKKLSQEEFIEMFGVRRSK
jgi:hypothetical protein